MKKSGEKQRMAAIAAMLGWCVLLIAYRLYRAPDRQAFGLLWNLFLALVPLGCSWAFQVARARRRRIAAGAFFFLWLLFLPNAPYILTDLIHLGPRPNNSLWFLMAMLLSCAGTGTILGFLSLAHVQGEIEKSSGETAGRIVAVASLLLCGFGIYLGRFLRLNSWNAFTHPIRLGHAIAQQFVDPGPHPHPLAFTLVFGLGLIVAYFALRAIAASTKN